MMSKQAGLAIGGAALLIGVVIMAVIPRGVRNNNPLNIRKGNDWNGETLIPQDTQFESFKNPVYGFRAGAKLIKNYESKYGLNTVNGIISRFAPANENDTESYIKSVSSRLSVSPNQALDLDKRMPELLHAIAHHENGGDYYSLTMIKAGIEIA